MLKEKDLDVLINFLEGIATLLKGIKKLQGVIVKLEGNKEITGGNRETIGIAGASLVFHRLKSLEHGKDKEEQDIVQYHFNQ